MTAKTISTGLVHTILSTIIIAACWLLFALDKDTHSFTDLLKPDNLAALGLYALPTYGICAGLYTLFSRKHTVGTSLTRSLVIGIPASFVLLIAILLALRPH